MSFKLSQYFISVSLSLVSFLQKPTDPSELLQQQQEELNLLI